MGIRRAEANEPGSLGDMYKVRNKDEAGRLCAVCALCSPRRAQAAADRDRGPKFIALDARISSCLASYEPTESGRARRSKEM